MSSQDRKRQQNATDYQGDLSQNNLNNLRDTIMPTQQQMANNYTSASGNAFADYGDIMGRYRDTFDSIKGVEPLNAEAMMVNYARTPELQKALSGYGEFADTGGFSEEGIRDIRARGVSPIRAAYGNALNEMERRKNLQGGYSPNANVLRAKMAREQGQLSADAMQNINAGIAESVQKGRLAGLGGLGNLSVQDIQFGQNAQLANQSARLRAGELNASPYSLPNQRLQALQGMSSLYSATPGQAETFGNQVLNSQRNLLGLEGQQQGLGQQQVQNQYQVAQLPTGFQAGLANAGRVGQIVGQVAGIWNPTGAVASNLIPSNRAPGANNINSGLYSSPRNAYY